MNDPWSTLAARITRLGDRIDALPAVREATVTALKPMAVRFDTDQVDTLVYGSLAPRVAVGHRVLTLKLRHYIWILGVKGGGMTGIGDWAYNSGPASVRSAFITAFHNRYTSSTDSFDPTHANGILVKKDGIYEVHALQRGNGQSVPNGYIALSMNGNRATLENRANCLFTHDHSPNNNAYTTSSFTGLLLAGEIVSMGPDSTGSGALLQYGTSAILGSLRIKRIG